MGCGNSKGKKVDATEAVSKAKVIFVVGGPGSGKGTQCAKLAAEYHFEHLSTGDILREERKKEGTLAKQLDEIMNAGKLVSSELTV